MIKLKLPFKEKFPITFKFGEISKNPEIKKKYLEWGIKGHNGVDFGLKIGIKVLAADHGKVIFNGVNGEYGLNIILEHKWGSSLYAHLSKIKVKLNKKVKRGQILGLSGSSGFTTGPHLHFGIKPKDPNLENGYLGFIDPEPYLKKDKKSN